MARTAVIVGVGPGLGESLARTFVTEGCEVGLFARSTDRLETLEASINAGSGDVLAVPTDIAERGQVKAGFERVREKYGPIDVLVHDVYADPSEGGLLDASLESFDDVLSVNPRGPLLCSQKAAADMLDGDGGTVLFTGTPEAVRGSAGSIARVTARFAVRGMVQLMARELGPEGIHVTHVTPDGAIYRSDLREEFSEIPDEEWMDPDAIAETYWHLVEQDRGAWTHELDCRTHAGDGTA
jgi:NAD(P)-dependent dehydrogenase (short-subunit alcohol dehydrogenase family)